MRAAIVLAVPAGLLSSNLSPVGGLFIFWMAGAAAWAVVLYMRSQRPAWITMGAGARIGLVTGLIAAWLAFGVTGAGWFVKRIALHQGPQIDSAWRDSTIQNEQISEQVWVKVGVPIQQIQQTIALQHNLVLSPEGHAGYETAELTLGCLMLVLFATAGGALSARTIGKNRRPTS